MNRQRTYIVKNSPWKRNLPVGTEVVPCEPRKGYENSQWYKRVDNELLFPNQKGEEDGKFVLRHNEIEKVKFYLVKRERLVTVPCEVNRVDDCEIVMTEKEFFDTADEETYQYTIVKEL